MSDHIARLTSESRVSNDSGVDIPALFAAANHVHACSIKHCDRRRNGCLCGCGVSWKDGQWLTSDEIADYAASLGIAVPPEEKP